MSKFRFHIQSGPEPITTPWEDELVKVGHGTSAGERITQLRAQYGQDARISVERLGDNKTPNIVPMVRYKIKVKEDIYYSRSIYEADKEKALAEIRTMFPKAEVTEEKL
jgi:hypothetical protein